MIFGYKANKCKEQIDAVQTEAKTITEGNTTFELKFTRSGNLVVVLVKATTTSDTGTPNILVPVPEFAKTSEVVSDGWEILAIDSQVAGVSGANDTTWLIDNYIKTIFEKGSNGNYRLRTVIARNTTEVGIYHTTLTYIVQ